MSDEFVLDFRREERIGLEEAVFAEAKSAAQIDAILDAVAARDGAILLTRLDEAKLAALKPEHRTAIDYCAVSCTAVFGPMRPVAGSGRVAVICAGTSDVPVAREALRTLRYQGEEAELIADVGVAGLWRLTSRIEEIRRFPVLVVAAGMDAALPSVVAGLVAGAVIAVPTSVGYGVAAGGHAALHAILASCAPGIATVNIDNGYGAACAALRLLRAAERMREATP
ncbi:nickel pincer cofactor biosynthesis protein LarB [Aureimonas leprariae]|uniref:Nickel pincer cofactor biosynthesis protein LarB n=1 Tax=Plantimonas leprariae TaxID=2615207 RepID=A0A7V7PRJ6_9HYPH|nr:nickel pincer cofactor biosynthesis protein LarB [Aureimonas leprariae]KAB0681408.1 nickel pincer cofactor biosynthesis protein LarB [Aureimonas leprariae]